MANVASVCTSQTPSWYPTQVLSACGNKVYRAWFFCHQTLVETCRRYVSPAIGACWGMVFLEAHTLMRASWHTFKKYRKNPKEYGLEPVNLSKQTQNPVLLIHGAAGSWNYLGDLATSLTKEKRSVFVINLGSGQPTNEKREKIYNKIEEIHKANKTLKIDIVAHSMGGNLALYSAFEESCSTIDKQGDLIFARTKKAHPLVAKVITIALPADEKELSWIKEIGKVKEFFNVTAKYEGLMGHKKCALEADQTCEINAAHIGIVFQKETQSAVNNFLSRRIK